jgi:hypothetical protein
MITDAGGEGRIAFVSFAYNYGNVVKLLRQRGIAVKNADEDKEDAVDKLIDEYVHANFEIL